MSALPDFTLPEVTKEGLYQLGLIMRQLVKALCQVDYQGCEDAQSGEN